ncbi:MAG: hypothetical protein ACLPID_03155, partial [Beijerinckiaceae bacterium]
GKPALLALEHVPEKWPHFSDKDMLQLFELARNLDRTGDSTRSIKNTRWAWSAPVVLAQRHERVPTAAIYADRYNE